MRIADKEKPDFKTWLKHENLAPATIENYVWTVNFFSTHYPELNKENLLEYKDWLIQRFGPNTVNTRILAMNKYCQYIGRDDLKLRCVKQQTKNFLENVISNADYNYFKKQLHEQLDNQMWYFAVWFMVATGARISELLKFKVEHVMDGYIDLYTKCGKVRRIYIPIKLKTEAMKWLNETGKVSGFIFTNKWGEPISARGISIQLKRYAIQFGVDPEVVYPHSFRHRFAKNFLDRYNDLSLLADLMGHEDIETTRIYLRKTSTEQREIVDRVVNW